MRTSAQFIIIFFICILTIGCNKQQPLKPRASGDYSTWEIIEKTESMAPRGLKGKFVLSLKNSGKQSGRIFLNTQDDYRDRRNITVTLEPSFQQQFKAQFDEDIRSYYQDKTIRVNGEAKRMKIWFFANGKRTTKYYFQTHIIVSDLNQITIL